MLGQQRSKLGNCPSICLRPSRFLRQSKCRSSSSIMVRVAHGAESTATEFVANNKVKKCFNNFFFHKKKFSGS